MAEHQRQRVHPVEVEAPPPPTASLVAPGLQNHPPLLRAIAMPAVHSKPPKRGCFCKCICWTLSLLVLLLIILAATAGILYTVFKPKLPNYSIDSLRISDLRLNFDMTLYAKFDVKITANNPNKKIGIYYEEGGRLSVWYTNTELCDGLLPQFYQGHQNKTVLNVSLDWTSAVWKHLNDGITGTTADRTHSIGSEGPCTGSHQTWEVEADFVVRE